MLSFTYTDKTANKNVKLAPTIDKNVLVSGSFISKIKRFDAIER